MRAGQRTGIRAAGMRVTQRSVSLVVGLLVAAAVIALYLLVLFRGRWP